jgi:dimethylhistidine N-methyltransferase
MIGYDPRNERDDAPHLGPEAQQLLRDALSGLTSPQKTLPCKYFYDELGSRLFDRICELDEYYPTRTELGIMEAHGDEMARLLGPRCLLVEYGSGSSVKTRLLLDRLQDPAGYVPIDISGAHLLATAEDLARAYPRLNVLPVCADYTGTVALPARPPSTRTISVYFPGSTIGNFHPAEAGAFLRRIASVCGAGGGLLIGVDTKKPRDVLERAYDDASGVTARFNLNILVRLNREIGADFRLDGFRHEARWNEARGRVEMHLVSRRAQTVSLAGRAVSFREGESIHTECSYKYTVEEFRALAQAAGFVPRRVWTDAEGLFSVHFLEIGEAPPSH